jgi:hypothetical protein
VGAIEDVDAVAHAFGFERGRWDVTLTVRVAGGPELPCAVPEIPRVTRLGLPGTTTVSGPCSAAVAGVAAAHRAGAGMNEDGSGVSTWLESTSTISPRKGARMFSSSSCSAFPTL